MTSLVNFIVEIARKDGGQDLLEYALLMALIAITAALTVSQLGQTVTNILWAPIVSSNI